MRSYILKGNSADKNIHIEKFINENNIQGYNVIRFDDPLKIGEARDIKKMLARSSFSQEKRVIIISDDPNVESQNALLKVIEELDEQTDIIFAGKLELLPTIQSRSFIKYLSSLTKSLNEDEDIPFDLEKLLLARTAAEKLIWLDNYFQQKSDDHLKSLILDLRGVLIGEITGNSFANVLFLLRFLQRLQKAFVLTSTNNLNPRIAAEKTLLSLTY